MKPLLFFLICCCSLIACNSDKNDDDTVVLEVQSDQYQLVASLFDPGDGSGTFMPVVSDRIITWLEDGTFSCNEDLCTGEEVFIEGTYNLEENILEFDCSAPLAEGFFFGFFFDDEQNLIITIPCIEPCWFKYQKL